MIAAAPRDDLVALGEAAHRLDLLGDLQGAFNRLGTSRAKEEAVEVPRRQPSQHVGELDRGEVRVGRRRGVGELGRLLRHGLRDLAASVADIDEIQPGEAIEIGFAARVPEGRAFAPHEDPEPVALGEVDPARAVDPDMLQRQLLELAGIVVRHGVIGHVAAPYRRRCMGKTSECTSGFSASVKAGVKRENTAKTHAAGAGASAAIKPACFSSAHSSPGIGCSTSRTFSSTSATDRAPGITEAMAGWARMNWSAAALRGTWCRSQTAAMRAALSIISGAAGR